MVTVKLLLCYALFYPHERVKILDGNLAGVHGTVVKQLPNCKYEIEVVVRVAGIPMFDKTVQAAENLKAVE